MKNQSVIKRIIFDTCTFLLVFVAPWWFMLVLLVAAIFIFPTFYEALFFAVLLDAFHGVPGVSFFGLNIFFTAIISCIFIVSIFLKTRLRFYQ